MSYTITLSSFFWSLKTHWNQDPKLFIYIASNPCKNMLVKLDHFPRVRGENKNYSKSPPSQGMVHFNCIYWNWTCEIQNHFPRKITPLFFSTHPNFPTAESLIHLVIAIEADRPASSNSFMDLSFNGSRVTFLEAMRSMEFPGSLNRW